MPSDAAVLANTDAPPTPPYRPPPPLPSGAISGASSGAPVEPCSLEWLPPSLEFFSIEKERVVVLNWALYPTLHEPRSPSQPATPPPVPPTVLSMAPQPMYGARLELDRLGPSNGLCCSRGRCRCRSVPVVACIRAVAEQLLLEERGRGGRGGKGGSTHSQSLFPMTPVPTSAACARGVCASDIVKDGGSTSTFGPMALPETHTESEREPRLPPRAAPIVPLSVRAAAAHG